MSPVRLLLAGPDARQAPIPSRLVGSYPQLEAPDTGLNSFLPDGTTPLGLA